jgi:hypothetical protein
MARQLPRAALLAKATALGLVLPPNATRGEIEAAIAAHERGLPPPVRVVDDIRDHDDEPRFESVERPEPVRDSIWIPPVEPAPPPPKPELARVSLDPVSPPCRVEVHTLSGTRSFHVGEPDPAAIPRGAIVIRGPLAQVGDLVCLTALDGRTRKLVAIGRSGPVWSGTIDDGSTHDLATLVPTKG